MPEGRFSFGVMSTPGACANQLRKEVVHAAVPRTPDAVCVLAPSNNLTASRTVEEAGAAFGRLLATVCTRWPKVFVADFVPRLTVDEGYQTLFRQELHRVAASCGLKYCHFADEFPLNRPELWAFDGVHLSDDAGMPILVQLLWKATYEAMEPPAARPQELRRVPSSASPRIRPRVVVRGEVPAPRPPPAEWTVVGSAAKVEAGAVASGESFLPLNPQRFSPEILTAMEKLVPSALSARVPAGDRALPVEHGRRPAALKRRRAQPQVSPTPAVPAAVMEGAPKEKRAERRARRFRGRQARPDSSEPSPDQVSTLTPSSLSHQASPPSNDGGSACHHSDAYIPGGRSSLLGPNSGRKGFYTTETLQDRPGSLHSHSFTSTEDSQVSDPSAF
ncbi:uncharacterized protein ACNS7B_024514 [Menidia menidia]